LLLFSALEMVSFCPQWRCDSYGHYEPWLESSVMCVAVEFWPPFFPQEFISIPVITSHAVLTCGWKACDVYRRHCPRSGACRVRSQCNRAFEGHVGNTEAYSSSCIDTTKKETLHNYESPTAGTRVSSCNVIGMWLTVAAVPTRFHMNWFTAGTPWLCVLCYNSVFCINTR
jgi:hypothetical protein